MFNLPSKKKIESNSINPYTIKFSKAERDRFDKLQAKYGFTTLSGLIRRALQVVETNPTFLSELPEMEQPSYDQAYRLLEQFQAQQKVEKESLEHWKDNVDGKLDWILKKLATNKVEKEEIKKIQNSSGAMEAIFDE